MISRLASPLVCVIDEDPHEFPIILSALNSLYVSSVHFRGDTMDHLPEIGQPLKGLRLVFTDLYLSSGAVGKDMASHTANVFRRIVSPDTAPILVVIWSKHVNESVSGAPQDDQMTEADLFKKTLLEAEPKFVGRLIFINMKKPSEAARPGDWVTVLKKEIEETLQDKEAIHALWIWEALVREAALGVSEGLTYLSQPPVPDPDLTLNKMKETMQLLVQAQGESDLTVDTAPRHLAAALSQLLVDQLDHTNGIEYLSSHGEWLFEKVNDEGENELRPKLNSFLLTIATPATTSSFMPGTVYNGIDDACFQKLFGVKIGELAHQTFAKRDRSSDVTPEDQNTTDKEDRKKWREKAKPVLIEVSPACDVAQGKRRSALLIAGLILPSEMRVNVNKGDAFKVLPTFSLRWDGDGFTKQDVFIVFASQFKVTLPATVVPEWLKPWFRLRELPTAALRNWHAGHASRVGYVSL